MIRCIDYVNGKGKFELEIDFKNMSMIESEEKIQETINEAGNIITEKRLKEFDTDGDPLLIGNIKFTSKGLCNGTQL